MERRVGMKERNRKAEKRNGKRNGLGKNMVYDTNLVSLSCYKGHLWNIYMPTDPLNKNYWWRYGLLTNPCYLLLPYSCRAIPSHVNGYIYYYWVLCMQYSSHVVYISN